MQLCKDPAAWIKKKMLSGLREPRERNDIERNKHFHKGAASGLYYSQMTGALNWTGLN